MKKSSFVAMMLGTVSGILFALGMCMTLLPEWNAFVPGVVLGTIGIVFGLITFFVWRKMEHKAPLKMNRRAVGISILITLGALILGIGMSLCLVWGSYVLGTLIGLVGILILLSLVAIIKGIK